jgi:hypothetical protein
VPQLLPLPQAPPASLGQMDPGRFRDFIQGVKEARDLWGARSLRVL